MTEYIPLVDLKAQYRTLKPAIDEAISRVVESTGFILGPEVDAFETAFAGFCHAKHAIGVGSGTAALELVLRAYNIGPGDEVITTPFTFIATAEAISATGATPVFADIDPFTYNLDPEAVEAGVSQRTRAIIPVHLYGQPAEMDTLMEIAGRHGLKVIEDAAQAHGATFRNRRVGNLGNPACFSFYPGKNLGCYGDGGAVVTNDDALASAISKLRNHGRSSKYVHDELGFGHRLDALQAAILSAKLPHLEAANVARRQLAARYTELLAGSDLILPSVGEHARSAWHLYVVRTAGRDRIMDQLRQQGIGAGVHYPIPLHLQPAYGFLEIPAGRFPVAEAAANQVLSLPLYPEMRESQQDRVAETLISLIS
ncbi:MAG: DegT/DnrJ/EryC1/StrS family aminotransferase [Chloroflexota bacterium]|nr:DegT/DnrJ/EryC1/StrS family aminotransferase [Chloroflexota bacterium]